MTSAMEAMHRGPPERERYPLPPRRIAMRVAEEAGVKGRFDISHASVVPRGTATGR
jgi:hypothetical protein